MTKTEQKQLKDIEFYFRQGVSDRKQAKRLGLSQQGFYHRYWSLRKKSLLAERKGQE